MNLYEKNQKIPFSLKDSSSSMFFFLNRIKLRSYEEILVFWQNRFSVYVMLIEGQQTN